MSSAQASRHGFVAAFPRQASQQQLDSFITIQVLIYGMQKGFILSVLQGPRASEGAGGFSAPDPRGQAALVL